MQYTIFLVSKSVKGLTKVRSETETCSCEEMDKTNICVCVCVCVCVCMCLCDRFNTILVTV